MVLYFSGTGNSKYAAKLISTALGDELISLNDKIRNSDHSDITAERLVFCVPTHCWRIPRSVESWIRKVSFSKNIPVWFIMTCGSDIGAAEKYIKTLCAEKDFTFMGVKQVVMPENYIAMFNAPEEKEAIEIIRKAEPDIRDAIAAIAAGEAVKGPRYGIAEQIKSGPVNPMFYKFNVKDKAFCVSGDCVSCGLCERSCPVNNISLRDGKPVWNGKCIHCMACICHCPKKAIEYGTASKGKPRYTCPE